MILIISHDASRTGAPIVLLHILTWLREKTKLEFEILLRNGGELVDEFKKIAPTHLMEKNSVFNRVLRKFHVASNKDELPSSLKNRKFQLIYSNTVTNGKLVSMLSRGTTRVITHVHEMDSWIERSGPENWNYVVNQTNHFIAVSEAVTSVLIRRGIAPCLITQIPECANSIAENSISARKIICESLGIPDDALIIGGGGAEMWRKGRDLFVQLAAGVHREMPGKNCHFIWLGSDPDRESKMWLEIDARYTGCDSKIHWVGSVKNPQDFLSAFDVFAMTSREDPMPLIAIEAGMHGLPIVCFQSAGGTAEWVQGSCGYSVPYLDVAAMVKAIKDLCEDSSLRISLGAKAREITTSMHSVDNVASRIAKIIGSELIDN